MQYIIYLDTFFLINFYMDYIILLMVSTVLKYTTTHLLTRRLLGAATGAVYACLILIFRLNGIIWKMISYFGIVMLMSFILNGKTGIRRIMKGCIYIYFFSCAPAIIMVRVAPDMASRTFPASLNLDMISPTFLVPKKFMGSSMTWR